MKTFKFGIIGCGLMGKEFASACARWCHLLNMQAKPEIIAISDLNTKLFPWYTDNFPSIKQTTTNYKELLANKDIDVIYCAVPHVLHQEVYSDIIASGKHFLGEKPFGMDLMQNIQINKLLQQNSNIFVRCSSEMPFYPGMQYILKNLQLNNYGKIIEIEAGFLHSSDMSSKKAINWKRMIEINGEYGCMGDLGMHVLHVPLRLGFKPYSVYAQLSKIVDQRPNEKGEMVPCLTYDNANILCKVNYNNYQFPMNLKTWRIAPGETDSWYFKIQGTKESYFFTTKSPRQVTYMKYEDGKAQAWQTEDLGYTPLFETITGPIFEFGFTDVILQMWAAFIDELNGGDANGFSCVTPDETIMHHDILSAALKSHKLNQVVEVKYSL
jgi:predicted dehydrogenase